jgi:hypothetical protein
LSDNDLRPASVSAEQGVSRSGVDCRVRRSDLLDDGCRPRPPGHVLVDVLGEVSDPGPLRAGRPGKRRDVDAAPTVGGAVDRDAETSARSNCRATPIAEDRAPGTKPSSGAMATTSSSGAVADPFPL